jgi:hypothetical protein
MVISRLKAECGTQFTSRFEQMFKDIQVRINVSPPLYHMLPNVPQLTARAILILSDL